MKEHRPDRDALTAFLDGALSTDARQWMEHHLESCGACREALERERALLGRLDSIRSLEPPADFTPGVMARVVQQPAHRPPVKVPWRRVAVWGSGIAAILVLVVSIGAWTVVNSGALEGSDASGILYEAIVTSAGYGSSVVQIGNEAVEKARALAATLANLVRLLFDLAADAGWEVQLFILLITVTLNYILTRMVLNYQRRQ